MKVIKLPLIIALILTILPACSTSSGAPEDDRISVVATVFAPYDFARQIASDNANVTMLLLPGVETHTFEPTAQDMAAIQNADVFIYVGGESDEWVRGVLDSVDTSAMRIVTLMDCVEPLTEELTEGMETDESESDEPEYDEHVWTSPANAKLIVGKIAEAIIAADPNGESRYSENKSDYLQKLSELDSAFQNLVDGAERGTVIFGDRFPFRYLFERYGLKSYAAFPGCSSETEPSSRTVAFLIDKTKELNIPVVFRIELSGGKLAETIAAESGSKVLELHSCHNISKSDFENGVTYVELMTRNVENLKIALN
jgi:zinc transport system substrate-binding protein